MKEILIQNDKNLPKEILDLVIKADKMLWYETFYPYPILSDEAFEYELKNTTSHFYYTMALEKTEIIGVLKVELTPMDTKKDTLFSYDDIPYLGITISESHRKKGLAKQLARYFVGHFPYSYSMIEYHIRHDREKGLDSFFQSIGASKVYTSIRAASNLQSFNLKDVQRTSSELETKAQTKGFTIKLVKNGHFSAANIPFVDYVRIVEHMKNSKPYEGRKHEPIKLNPNEYKKRYKITNKLPQEVYTMVAIDRITKKPIAFTESWYYLNHPELVVQGDTGVLTSYRGNKLGLTLKYKMLQFLLTSKTTKKAEYWTTNNAQSNKYMIAINTELKYEENGLFYVYYLSKENFLNYIRKSNKN